MRLDEDYLRELELAPLFALRRARDGVATPTLAPTPEPARALRPPPTAATRVTPAATPPRGLAARADKPVVDVLPVDTARLSRIAALPWEALAADIAACTACELCHQRKNVVPGIGARAAPWLFVGEGPGAEEDLAGEPFVGAAGKLLDQMLIAAGLKRGREVFIANVVKCRPPGNRTPTLNEAAACAPYLDRQIDLIQPKLIVALGKTAALRLTGSDETMAALRGKRFRYRQVPVVATYHPSYLLRNLPEKQKAWEDLLFARRQMAEVGAEVL